MKIRVGSVVAGLLLLASALEVGAQAVPFVGTKHLTTYLSTADIPLLIQSSPTPGWPDTTVACPGTADYCVARITISAQIANVVGGCVGWNVLKNGLALEIFPSFQGCLDSTTLAVDVYDTRTMTLWGYLSAGTSNVISARFTAPAGTTASAKLRVLSIDVFKP